MYNEKMKELNTYENHQIKEKTEEAKKVATFLTLGIMNESAQIYTVSSIQNLLNDKLPLEFLMLQYLIRHKEARKDISFKELVKALKNEDGRKIIANYGMDPKLGKYHRTYCDNCNQVIETKEPVTICPHCGSDYTYLLTGNEFNIKEIEAR